MHGGQGTSSLHYCGMVLWCYPRGVREERSADCTPWPTSWAHCCPFSIVRDPSAGSVIWGGGMYAADRSAARATACRPAPRPQGADWGRMHPPASPHLSAHRRLQGLSPPAAGPLCSPCSLPHRKRASLINHERSPITKVATFVHNANDRCHRNRLFRWLPFHILGNTWPKGGKHRS